METKSLLKEVKQLYKQIKPNIEKRILEFKNVWLTYDSKDIFYELSFCLLTPQSKAVICDKAIKALKQNDLIFTGSEEEIKSKLIGVRFKNNKTKYILFAKDLFCDGNKIRIKSFVDPNNIFETREWLVKNVKGMGYKEASHFLRNIGFGEDIAILDRHILKNLNFLGVIDQIPKTLSKSRYLLIEDQMRNFCKIIDIPLGHLDLVLWHKETGYIFK